MATQFVGRRNELLRLRELLQESHAGRGQLITIAGQAGIGKTRLMTEAADLATHLGNYVLWSQIIEDPVAPPYTAWLLALRDHLQQVSDDTLRSDLGSGAVHVADIVPELRDRLGLGASRPPADTDSAARFQLYDSVTRMMLAVAKRKPLVLLFDNLHLADQSSLALLQYYARQLTNSATLVIAAYRDYKASIEHSFQERLTDINRSAGAEQLNLGGLSQNEVAELLRNTLQTKPTSNLVDAVCSRGEGNPLFTYQVATDLAKRHQDSSEIGPVSIPSSLANVIETRLKTVSTDANDVLRCAAILGRDFEVTTLSDLCGGDIELVSASMAQAADAGILVYLNPGRFRFEHALFREVLYNQHSSQERQQLHHNAAKSLGSRSGDDAEPPTAQLAYHWFESSRERPYPQAIDWCRRAAHEANAKRAYDEATVQIQRVLALVDATPEQDPVLRFELLSELADAQYLAGQQGLSNRTWLKAALLAYHHRWPLRLANAVLKWQYVRAATGLSHMAGVPLHEAALKLLPTDSEAMRTRLLASLALAFLHQDDSERARMTLFDCVELARNIGDADVLFDCLTKAFYVLNQAYDAPERLAMLVEASHLAPLSGREENELLASVAILFPLSHLGRFTEIRRSVEELAERSDLSGHNFWRQVVAGFQVKLAIFDGRWSDALRLAQQSMRQGSFEGATGVEGRFGFQMFEIHRALGTLSSVGPLFSKILASADNPRVWLSGRILLHCELGQKKEARDGLEQLGDLSNLSTDDLYVTSLVYLTLACTWLGDKVRCRQLHKLLTPYRGFNLTLVGTVSHGAASGYLAVLAVTMRRQVEARILFEEALQHNETMGAQIAVAKVSVDFAEFLTGSDVPADKTRAQMLLAAARTTAKNYSLRPLIQQIDFLGDENNIRACLTKREVDVLHLIASGASNKRLAQDLHISPATVATHIRNILRKTRTSNRTEAVAYARQLDLLPPN